MEVCRHQPSNIAISSCRKKGTVEEERRELFLRILCVRFRKNQIQTTESPKLDCKGESFLTGRLEQSSSLPKKGGFSFWIMISSVIRYSYLLSHCSKTFSHIGSKLMSKCLKVSHHIPPRCHPSISMRWTDTHTYQSDVADSTVDQ